jgi:Sec7-like guanine-nucleotide exchange factor
MTLQDFEKMIKGINAGQNLETKFIQKIYETVEKEPFTLNEDDDARFKQEAASATTFKRKQELF